jgi:hypothetical protein
MFGKRVHDWVSGLGVGRLVSGWGLRVYAYGWEVRAELCFGYRA